MSEGAIFSSQLPEKQSLAQAKIDRFDQLSSDRKTYETHWQECYDFIVPRKNDITVLHAPGVKRGNTLFDTTAIMANNMLAGQLHAKLTNPTTRFFDLIASDPKANDDDQVKEWLVDSADKMVQVLNGTNFQTEIHEVYIDEGCIGTAGLYMGEHQDKIIHFSARSMREVFVDENALGLIDTVYRWCRWNIRQLIKEFGKDKLPKDFVAREGKDTALYDVLHCVEPMSDEEISQKGAFAFSSVWMLKEEKFILDEKNYHEFPYAIPRWTKTSGEKYGRGPGMDMLPDIRMVNKMMETVLKGAQKTVDPPLMVADDGVIGQVKLTPGGLTVVRPSGQMDMPIKPLITNANVEFGQQLVENTRERIRAGFYVDQLSNQLGDRATTAEVNSVDEQKMSLMGPILGRQHFELLLPLVTRLFGVMNRRKMFKPAPVALAKGFEPRYSSLIARAQRMSEGQAIGRGLQVAGPIIQLDPDAADVIKADDMVKGILVDIYGVNPKFIRNKRELAEVRKAKQDAKAKMAQQQDEQHQAEVAGKVLPAVAQIKQAQNQVRPGSQGK